MECPNLVHTRHIFRPRYCLLLHVLTGRVVDVLCSTCTVPSYRLMGGCVLNQSSLFLLHLQQSKKAVGRVRQKGSPLYKISRKVGHQPKPPKTTHDFSGPAGAWCVEWVHALNTFVRRMNVSLPFAAGWLSGSGGCTAIGGSGNS